jgi:hypothetical protein
MARLIRTSMFLALIFVARPAFAGGACPSGANYPNPANPTGPLVTLSSIGVTSCYFASQQSGASDSNSGTSESSPWNNIPGMASCASNCASNRPTGGIGYILRGCDSWLSTALPVSWSWSGSSGSPIYIGIDKTWYNSSLCSSAWNRPIFNDASGTVYSPNALFNMASSGLTSYITLDNIEFKNLTCTTCGGDTIYVWCVNSCTNTIVSNSYFHALNVSQDNGVFLVGYGASSHSNLVETSVFDGSDAAIAGTGVALGGGPLPNAENNVIHDMPNGIVGYNNELMGVALTISGNNIYNIAISYMGANHENFIESTGPGNGPYLIYNNVLHDQIASGVEAMFIGNAGEVDYVWNNVVWNIGNEPGFDTRSGTSTVSFYNNTIVPLSGASCISQTGTTAATLTIANTHCITTGSLTAGVTGSPTLTSNVVMTPTQAAAAGYSTSETYAYSPTTSNCSGQLNCPVRTGTNFSSIATGNLAGLVRDSTYACTQQTVSGVVQAVCPARTANARPSASAGAWDIGADEYGDPPSAPTSLTATVQ